jgi:hypothetical protein
MYSECVFCESDLGRNDALASLPIGRRIAFDASLGRLWIICPRCARWNLTPIEERWEPIEEAERLFRSTSVRLSTDNIGLARLATEFEVVRIGAPLRPEFAAWRYGAHLRRRHRKALTIATGALTVGGIAAGAGLAAGAVSLGLLTQAVVLYNSWRTLRTVIRIPVGDGTIIGLRRPQVWETRVVADGAAEWRIHLRASTPHRQVYTFAGADADRIAALLLPRLNPNGAGDRVIQNCVGEIEAAGGSREYLRQLVRHPPKLRRGVIDRRPQDGLPLIALPGIPRLAFEMALHEEYERKVLSGELAGLERGWREANEIGSIADNLLLPDDIPPDRHDRQ